MRMCDGVCDGVFLLLFPPMASLQRPCVCDGMCDCACLSACGSVFLICFGLSSRRVDGISVLCELALFVGD